MPFWGFGLADIGLLVGRDRELQVLVDLLDALDAAETAIVLQVTRASARAGCSRSCPPWPGLAAGLVLSGRAAEFEAENPFGVFGDALDDWLAALDRDRLAVLSAGLEAELATVFAAFGPLVPERAPELQPEERYRAYRAVRALLCSLAQDKPVVLVLDDVQWAVPARWSSSHTCSRTRARARSSSRSGSVPRRSRRRSTPRCPPRCATTARHAWSSAR